MDKLKIFSLAPVASKLDNGEIVYLKRLTALDRVEWIDGLTASINADPTRANSAALRLEDAARLLSYCLSDDQGKRLFGDDELEVIKQIDSKTLDRLANQALEISGLTAESNEDAKKN